MTQPSLSFVIVNDAYLKAGHLTYAIDALNRQDCPDFNVYWLNQQASTTDLDKALGVARFPSILVDPAYPFIKGVCCWETPSVLSDVLAHSHLGNYLVYLHKECLPESDFVSQVLHGVETAEKMGGRDNVYILNQLRSSQTVDDLGGLSDYLEQLRSSELKCWTTRSSFVPLDFTVQIEPWQEDAFCIPTALARQLQLYSCLLAPLFFQDIFDILYQLPDKPYASHIHWLRLGQPLIYHLNHPRYFYEFSPDFFREIKRYPHLFRHLALYDLADTEMTYQEPFIGGQRQIRAPAVSRFMHFVKYSFKGTMTHWNAALDLANQ